MKPDNSVRFNKYPTVKIPCLASVVPVIHVAFPAHAMDVAEIQTKSLWEFSAVSAVFI